MINKLSFFSQGQTFLPLKLKAGAFGGGKRNMVILALTPGSRDHGLGDIGQSLSKGLTPRTRENHRRENVGEINRTRMTTFHTPRCWNLYCRHWVFGWHHPSWVLLTQGSSVSAWVESIGNTFAFSVVWNTQNCCIFVYRLCCTSSVKVCRF